METIGEQLRRVRKTCGHSLEDVAHVTRINLRYLEAIENDEFSKLPGQTFLKGFLRSYARFLCIDEKELISKVRDKKWTETHASNNHETEKNIENTKTPTLKSKYIRIILPLSAVVIVLMVIIMLFGGNKDTSKIQNSKEVKEVIVLPGPVEVQQNKIVQPPPVHVEQAEPLLLKLSAKELTWIQAKLNDSEKKEVLLKPGESVLWKGEDKITMTLGNAGGVEAEINGKSLEPFGKRGEVVRDIVITRAGVYR